MAGPAKSATNAEFCDTNLLVSTYDASAGVKRAGPAPAGALWLSGTGVLSIQVLQELDVSLTRKLAQPLPPQQARQIVADLAIWRLVTPTGHDVLEAIDANLRWQVAFWDAMLVTAARKAGAGVLWSEDLNDGQNFDGTVVRNPFRG